MNGKPPSIQLVIFDWAYASLDDEERVARLNHAAMTFRDFGAHATIRFINELPALVNRLHKEAADHPHVLSPLRG